MSEGPNREGRGAAPGGDTLSTYILLLTLTDRGREMALEVPDHILKIQDDIAVGGTEVLSCYAVLGGYDFVSVIRAADNDAAARFSLELGVRGGVHVVTMPSIPVGRLEEGGDIDLAELETEAPYVGASGEGAS